MFTAHRALWSFCCLASLAAAQEPPTEAASQPIRIAISRADQQLATMLTHGDEEQLAVATAASPGLQNAAVKSFARKTIEVHVAAMKELQPVVNAEEISIPVPAAGQPLQAARDQPPDQVKSNQEVQIQRGNQTQVVPLRPDGTPAARAPLAPAGMEAVRVSGEVRDAWIGAAKEELSKTEGRDYDLCYLSLQMAAQRVALAKLKALQRHASPVLQPQLDNRARVGRERLVEAQMLFHQLAATPTTAQPASLDYLD